MCSNRVMGMVNWVLCVLKPGTESERHLVSERRSFLGLTSASEDHSVLFFGLHKEVVLLVILGISSYW